MAATKGLSAWRMVIAALCVGFVALNVWAFQSTPLDGATGFVTEPLSALGDVVPEHRWATVVASDLVFGWCLMAFVIAYSERSARHAAAWIIAMFAIGNLVAGVYLILRLPRLRIALASQDRA